MALRRKLASTYTKSPAQRMQRWFTTNLSKFIFAIIISLLYLPILYVAVGIVKFMGANFADWWEKDTPTEELFNNPVVLPVKVLGIILIFIYVFKDRPTKR